MRLLLCGGGTAGHVTPALVVAEELKRRYPKAKILFIGRKGGNENEAVKKANIELKTIEIQGLKRSLSLENIKRLKLAAQAKKEAEGIIKEFKPDVILGTGGYVCWPIIYAGKKLNVPIAIHESNAYPGLTTRLLASKCDAVFLGREEAKLHLNKHVNHTVVGNPVSKQFTRITYDEARKKLGINKDEIFILSFGGSIGADKLNRVVIDVMKNHSSKDNQIRHVHATGKRYFDNNMADIKFTHSQCKIVPYIDNMPTMLRAADIVICRCGAMTIAELSSVGVASILIPSPNVSGNHQYKNAKKLSERGAAVLIEEKNLTENSLWEVILELRNDKLARNNKAENILAFFVPDSAKMIVEGLISIKNNTKGAAF